MAAPLVTTLRPEPMTARTLTMAALAYRVATRDLLPLLIAFGALAYTLGAMLRHRLTRRPVAAAPLALPVAATPLPLALPLALPVAVAPLALPPVPVAPLEPSPLAGLTVASLRTIAARRGLPSASYRKARRVELLALLA